LAGVIIGALYILLDEVFATKPEAKCPSLLTVVAGIACFILQYFLSGVLLGPLGPDVGFGGSSVLGSVMLRNSEVVLWLSALLHWGVFDCTSSGFIVAILTAIGGPLIEIGLLNIPPWQLYAYALPDILGIPTWIAAVYFCGAPAVGNLARLVHSKLQ